MKKPFSVLLILLLSLSLFACSGNKDDDEEQQVNTNASQDQEQPIKESAEEPWILQETAKHRDNIYGISNKDVAEIDAAQFYSSVRNDTTDNWRKFEIVADTDFLEYARCYYDKYFESNDEIHAIINLGTKTSTCIKCSGDRLDVTIHEYVDKEQHDANIMFSGNLVGEYFVYLDNGDIEKVQ